MYNQSYLGFSLVWLVLAFGPSAVDSYWPWGLCPLSLSSCTEHGAQLWQLSRRRVGLSHLPCLSWRCVGDLSPPLSNCWVQGLGCLRSPPGISSPGPPVPSPSRTRPWACQAQLFPCLGGGRVEGSSQDLTDALWLSVLGNGRAQARARAGGATVGQPLWSSSPSCVPASRVCP